MTLPEVDMSPDAITLRLKEWSKLWRLWQKLRDAKDMGPVEPERARKTGQPRKPGNPDGTPSKVAKRATKTPR